MGKPLKILLSSIAAVLLLTLSAAIALSYLIDPNDYKLQIIAFVKEKTGRDLEMPGDITLSFFPWLGISTGKIILKNNSDFQDRPFATIEQSEIKVKLMPLFAKRIQVSTVVLKGLNLNLIKNKQGIRNWDDFPPADKTKTETFVAIEKNRDAPAVESSSRALAALAINGIAVERARIDWDDQESGKRFGLTELNLKTDAFTFGHPVGITMSFQIATEGEKPAGSVNLTSKLSLNDSLTAMDLTNLDLNYTGMDVGASAHPLTAHLTAADIAFDRPNQSLKLTDLQLNYGELNIAANLRGHHIIDKPVIEGPVHIRQFNPAQLLKQLSFTVPKMQDKKAFSKLAIQFNLLANADSLGVRQLAGQLDDTLIKGAGALNYFKQPAVNFQVSLNALDADRYLPAKTKTDAAFATPAVALAAVLSNLPADTLSTLNINGAVLLDQLKINGLTMKGVHFAINGNHGNVVAKQSIRTIYRGSYSGELSLKHSNRQSELSLNEKIEQVHLEPLLKDLNGKAKIRGVVNASTHFQGQGGNSKEIKSGLTGQLNFFLKDAAIKGFNIQKIIDGVLAKNNGITQAVAVDNDQTVFSEITGTASLRGGVVQNHDLVGRSSRFQVKGSGSANLKTEALDYKLLTKLVKKQATATEPEQFHSTPVLIHIGGTFDQPSYALDVSALLTEKNKAKIDKLLDKKKEKIDKFLDKLDKKMGPGTSDLLKNFF